MKKCTSFNVWNAGGGSFFGNCAANVCPWRSRRGSWRKSRSRWWAAVRGHAAAGHVRGWTRWFPCSRWTWSHVARAARGHARYAGRAYNWNGGRNWGGNYWYPSYGYSRIGYYGLGYGYPYYGSGYYGYRYGGYYPYYGNWGYYPYLYGYWPSVTFSFGY